MSKLVSRLQPTLVREMAQSITSIPLILCRLHRKSMLTRSFLPERDVDFECRGRFVEYLLERQDVKGAWKEHTHHDFVAGLADGSLPVEAFKYYLVQDYLYLVCSSPGNINSSADLARFNLQEPTPWPGTKLKRWKILRL